MHREVVHMKGFKNILGQNVVSYFGEKLPYAVQSVLFSPDCGIRQTMGALCRIVIVSDLGKSRFS